MMSLQQIHDRLAHAFSSERLSSSEQRKRAKDYPEDVIYMGTRTWCNLGSSEVMDMQRALAAMIKEDASE